MLNFQDLYESFAPDIYRFAFWLAGDRAEAEDITSETFVRAWTSSSKIRTETLKAYLFAIARNVFLQQRRQGKRETDLADIYHDPAPGPATQVEQHEELEAVRKTLETLPEVDRTAFILRVQHELPYSEVARALQISLASAKVKVHRARKRLLAARIDKEVRT